MCELRRVALRTPAYALGGMGVPGAAGTPGAAGMPGAAGTPGAAGMPGAAAPSFDAVAPHCGHTVAVAATCAPHWGHFIGALMFAGLKHMVSRSFLFW